MDMSGQLQAPAASLPEDNNEVTLVNV